MRDLVIPGVNIQWPWSRLILEGQKTVETRGYPLPEKYLNQDLAIIETPGPKGKKFGIAESRIIGIVRFSGSFKYESFEDWAEDHDRHRVAVNDPTFAFSKDQEKWGWIISEVTELKKTRPAPAKRGIVFATNCEI